MLGLPGKLCEYESIGVPERDCKRGEPLFAGANPLGLNLRPDVDFAGLFDTGAESNKTARCSNFLASSNSLLSFNREVATEDGV